MLCLCVRQSFSWSNLNPFWPWCQFHLGRSGGLIACRSPTVHSIISTGEKYKITRNTLLAFRKCKKLWGHRARRWMDRKGDFQLPTFKLSSRTAGEMYKQLLLTNVLQEHLLTRDSDYFNPFLLQHRIISSTQLARHPNRSFPSFLFRIKILFTPSLYTHISDVGWL